uniref:Uncharacterized protein n=1 Tax=Pseudomonas fluorescens (strain SBW25) TaxID=216595 RepID=A0A0G4E599_PSEFS|nr:hypothetical protein [Pseudomonas fluorescens]CEK42178.1 hypothetical protein PQBR57_0225 [Pseudomonas fluorescens SBW25]
MKDTVQIKASLIVGQHDALIEFYGRFNRLFVNKLLLKLCEGVIKDYEPSLALFQSNVMGDVEVARKVAIRIEKDKHPLMWAFYKDLPYGSRTMVIINLMNHYATLAEADATIMEKTYWTQRPDGESKAKDVADPQVSSVQQATKPDEKHAQIGQAEIPGQTDKPRSAAPAPSQPEILDTDEQQDPLAGFSTGL